MEKFENTIDLLKASWNVLKKDREILFFPVLSGISVLVLLASFVVPTVLVGDPASVRRIVNEDRDTLMMMGFVFYFLNYLIIIFFNSAIVACATIRMKGSDPTVFDGLNIATARIFHIIMWALVSATLGMIFRMIQEKSNLLGKILGGLLGIAWSLTSYLVVPVMVNENKGPLDSFMDSVELIKKTWGGNPGQYELWTDIHHCQPARLPGCYSRGCLGERRIGSAPGDFCRWLSAYPRHRSICPPGNFPGCPLSVCPFRQCPAGVSRRTAAACYQEEVLMHHTMVSGRNSSREFSGWPFFLPASIQVRVFPCRRALDPIAPGCVFSHRPLTVYDRWSTSVQ